MESRIMYSISTLPLFLCFSCVLFCDGLDHESTLRALLTVRTSFVEDPSNVLGDWTLNNPNYCGWRGVSCGSNKQVDEVVGLDLSNSSLTGSISPSLAGLQNLLHLDLSSNQLTGSIPPQLGDLRNLQHLILGNNFLNGSIPLEVCGLVGLIDLSLWGNTLVGSISPFIGNLTNMKTLELSHNNLHGVLPREIGKLGKLETLSLNDNQLSGRMPMEIGNCSSLLAIYLSSNHLSGRIPINLGRLEELSFLHLGQNELVGEIPAALGNCVKLIKLNLADNMLSGGIPKTLGFLRNLKQLILFNNSFQGKLPSQLGNLANLTIVNLFNNGLNGSVAPLCSLQSLVYFDVTHNAFTGEIPSQLGNSPSLKSLSLGNNKFSGEIPTTLGNISRLSFLDLSRNSIKGQIPDELGNLLSLGELKLSSNHFSGTIPPSIFKLPRLLVLSLGNNSLYGPIPPSIGNLIHLYELQLSRNNFSGEIPTEIGNLHNLQTVLNLSYNHLSGHIPRSLGKLSKLLALDLSHNQLTGEVPVPIAEMGHLEKLDISYNNFQGSLDNQFSHWPHEAFEGNPHLCGASLGSCNQGGGSHKKLSGLTEVVIISAIAIFTLTLILLGVLVVRFCLKNKQNLPREGIKMNSAPPSPSSHPQRTLVLPLNADGWRDFRFEDIMDATNNFSDEFRIGSGGSGSVYRVELPAGEIVAVKVISCMLNESFRREVETLGRIKHRRLVKLIGCVSHRSKGTGLLIYEYMDKGSVWDWLHRKPREANGRLDWNSRYKIALGLAQGVEYLHHDCSPKIVHRDIKSSNILLDSKMDAHLGDFGLAKALTENHDSSTECFAGSCGYMAPEFANTVKATEKSDVYSMGIVLMELVSGKMPTDAVFTGDMDMVRWVEQGIVSVRREELIDPMLKPILPEEEVDAFQVLEIAMLCTKSTPQERPSSREVCILLQQVSNQNPPGGC